MATAERDLWPTIIPSNVNLNTPLTVIREQASLLKKKTNGLVKAEVKVSKNFEATLKIALNHNEVIVAVHSFYLAAPALQYKYLLFSLLQPIEMYPLFITDSPIGDARIESEEELIRVLKGIFSSEKTQKVLEALIAQSISESVPDNESEDGN